MGTLKVTGVGSRGMTGNAVFLLVLGPPVLRANWLRDIRSENGEAIFVLTETQAILLVLRNLKNLSTSVYRSFQNIYDLSRQ